MDLNISNSHAVNKYIFNSRKQEINESIDDFATALSRLGSSIGYEEHQIIDRFVAGLANDNSRMGILQAHDEPYSLEMAVSMAKSNEHETIMYSADDQAISVTETSVATAGQFEGYQVIVMQNQDPVVLDTLTGKSTKIEDHQTYTSNETVSGLFLDMFKIKHFLFQALVHQYASNPVTFAKKSAALRECKRQLECSTCGFKCMTPLLMNSHCWTVHNFVNEGSKVHFCDECTSRFITRASLEAHLVMAHQYSKEEFTKKRFEKLLSPEPSGDSYEIIDEAKPCLACEVCEFKAA